MSCIDLATQFKIGMYLLNSEKRLNAFPRSTDIIKVLNELPTDKRHIKLRYHKIDCLLIHVDNKRKKFSKKNIFSVLHDQTSVKSPIVDIIYLNTNVFF